MRNESVVIAKFWDRWHRPLMFWERVLKERYAAARNPNKERVFQLVTGEYIIIAYHNSGGYYNAEYNVYRWLTKTGTRLGNQLIDEDDIELIEGLAKEAIPA